MDLTLPDKQFFKIGEVSELLGVKPYVLRYWEREFALVRPQKSRTNQRVYSRKDVELIARVKHLLYEQKFTIAGAKQKLREGRAALSAAEGAGTETTGTPSPPPPRATSFIEERERLVSERDALAQECELLRSELADLDEAHEALRALAQRELRALLADLGRDDALDAEAAH